VKPFLRTFAVTLCMALLLGLTPRKVSANQQAKAQPKAQAKKTKAVSDPKPAAAVDLTALKSFGSKSAPITMEIFSDFQCPACRNLYLTVWRPLEDNYVNTGKVYVINRDFPLQAHAYSRIAARYANAAARIGKFEKVEEVLFTKQDVWGASGDVDGTVASVLTPAEMAKVRQLVQSGTLDAGIEKDMALGKNYRVSQTPTIIITQKGQMYPVAGVVSYAILRQFLDQLLAQN
jgi:protein-disulfide isomerase